MPETTIDYFSKHLRDEVGKCVEGHDILRVRRPEGDDFVVLSASDWAAIEESLYLNQIPGLVDSIHKAHAEPLDEGTPLEDLDW